MLEYVLVEVEEYKCVSIIENFNKLVVAYKELVTKTINRWLNLKKFLSFN